MANGHGCDYPECWFFSQGDCSTADAVAQVHGFIKVYDYWAPNTWCSCLDLTEQHSLESLPVQREDPLAKAILLS